MIWAFAKGDHVASLLYEQMKGQFERMKEDEGGLSCFKAQELSNILWSCAKTQHWAKGHFHLAEREAKGVLAEAAADGEGGAAEADSMVPLEVSDEIWKAAVIGKCAEVMFETIEEELCTRDLDTFNTQHLANMAWAFVVLEHSRFNRQSLSGHKLLKRLLEVSEARIDEFAIEVTRLSTGTCVHPSPLQSQWAHANHISRPRRGSMAMWSLSCPCQRALNPFELN